MAERRIWMHWQNLNEDRAGRVKGSVLRLGRAWLHVFSWTFGWSWSIGKIRWALEADVNGTYHEPITLHLGLPGFSGWFHAQSPLLHRLTRGKDGESGLNYHDGTIHINIWKDPWGWDSAAPWWRQGISVNVKDLILGRDRYTSEVLSEVPILVPMPEKSYRGTAKMCRDIWSRARWRKKVIYRAHVDMQEPIPEPGKGENAYDCGEDACHGMTTEAVHVEDVIAEIVRSVLNARRRYGGSACDWRPETKVTA